MKEGNWEMRKGKEEGRREEKRKRGERGKKKRG